MTTATPTGNHAQSTQQDQQQTGPEAPQQEHAAVLFNTVTSWRSEDHATYLGPRAVGAAQTAIQGVKSILAILMQHQVDTDCSDNPKLFGSNIADGLLCAAESCTTLIECVIDGEHFDAKTFDHDTPEEKYMRRHACDIASGRKVVVTGDGGKAGAEA